MSITQDTVTQDTVVTLNYQVTNPEGKFLDGGALSYLHGGYEDVFPKVEAALEGQALGFDARIELGTADAFGERRQDLIKIIPKSEFPPGVKVGGQVERTGTDGQDEIFTVTKIKGTEVHLDANHPLAGQVLHFRCKVTGLRPATEMEIAHRHVHGAGEHHH